MSKSSEEIYAEYEKNIINDEYVRNFIYREVGYFQLAPGSTVEMNAKSMGVVTKINVKIKQEGNLKKRYLFGFGIYGKKSITLEEEFYYLNNKLHNLDGPAMIIHHPREFINNKQKESDKYYYIDGVNYSYENYLAYKREMLNEVLSPSYLSVKNGGDITNLVSIFTI